MIDESEISLPDFLRLLAEAAEKSNGEVALKPVFLREIADRLENTIIINSSKGEEICRIEGDDADWIVENAVEKFVRESLTRAKTNTE